MRVPISKPLLARTPPDRFVGREEELERLYLRAIASIGRPALHVEASPGAGLSELLRQVYDRAFAEQRFVVPFYFAVTSNDATAHAAAARYQYQFILQAIAFRRNQGELIAASPDICELGKLAPLPDVEWVDQMCDVCQNEGPLNDERAFIRTALNAPFRAAAAANLQVVAIVDDLHELATLSEGQIFRRELLAIAERQNVSLILASRKGSIEAAKALERFEVDELSRAELADLVGRLALESSIETTDMTQDLIAAKFAGKPLLVELFLQSAGSKGVGLAGYKDVEKLYTEELLSGRLGAHFDRIFSQAVADVTVRQSLYNELYLAQAGPSDEFSTAALRDRLAIGNETFSNVAARLNIDGILEIDNATASVVDDKVLADFLAIRSRSSAAKRTKAASAALTVTTALKRAPKMMSRIYRRESALGLEEILLRFDVQDVPRALLDFRIFRDDLVGLSEGEIREKAFSGGETFTLPQLVHAAPINDHLTDFDSAEPERAVIGIGFKDQSYRDEDEVAWLAAEIDSKLEADPSLTLEWCDRLDRAAKAIGHANYRIWLVAPEGFSEGALDILAERNALGSSRRQAKLLRDFLTGAGRETVTPEAVFEIVIPTGGESELVAAHAFEEIARRNEFPAKAVNQIKTALVEACINVAEHASSPDGRIHLKFAVQKEKVTITVSNRGLRLTDRTGATDSKTDEGRRGWGLGLIRNLMDEVRVVPVDDGTWIEMTKLLSPR